METFFASMIVTQAKGNAVHHLIQIAKKITRTDFAQTSMKLLGLKFSPALKKRMHAVLAQT